MGERPAVEIGHRGRNAKIGRRRQMLQRRDLHQRLRVRLDVVDELQDDGPFAVDEEVGVALARQAPNLPRPTEDDPGDLRRLHLVHTGGRGFHQRARAFQQTRRSVHEHLPHHRSSG